MTPTEINTAIAEWMGYRKPCWSCAERGNLNTWRNPQDSGCVTEDFLPNFHGDLNAVHEAEAKLDGSTMDVRSLYYDYLACCVQHWPKRLQDRMEMSELDYALIRATAPQRCEALLRTLGLWKGETK